MNSPSALCQGVIVFSLIKAGLILTSDRVRVGIVSQSTYDLMKNLNPSWNELIWKNQNVSVFLVFHLQLCCQ